ncbi:MAG TPA: Fe-S protein assembly co-chaperone HscB [Candidatus Bathyarchaeia archaeon]|nr:Fe-S protein assembly co-chaperone HscB [Candidatus Bathyarchaeia archaeon]
MTDYFEVFGLPRKLQIDLAALQQSFYELSRRHHPDFHQGAAADAQARALEASALVNRAYRTLRDPIARVEYLIALEEGRELREETTAKARAPMDLLAEMLEVQEALEEAKASGLTERAADHLRAEKQRLVDRHQAETDALVAAAPEWDAVVDAGGERKFLLERFKQRLATRAYLRTVIDDLTQAIGGSEEQDVAHRRH